MTRVRVENFTISLDGYGAGPDQGIDNPLGVGGEALHDWLVGTHTWRQAHGKEGGTAGIDGDFAARSARNVGGWIMGRNMFGPGPVAAVIGLIVGFTLMGLTFGPMAAILPELFPANVRYTGSAVAYNLSSVIGAAPASFIAIALWQAAGGSTDERE